jgi:hypothetical protein
MDMRTSYHALNRLRVFDNTGFKRIFVPRREDVTEYCKKLHNETLNILYYPTVLSTLSNQRG